MRQRISHVLVSLLLLSTGPFAGSAVSQLIPFLGGQRAGISTLQFLKIAPGARAAAMAEAFTALADDPTALHFNPAGIARLDGLQVLFTHTAWLVDVRHEYAAVTYRLSRADAVGVSITSLGTDDMEIRTETQPFGTGRYFSYGDVGIACTYARSLTDRFSAGITLRYAEEQIDVLKTRAVMVDIGTYYRTGLGSTRFSVAVNNFGANVSPAGSVPLRDGGTVSSFQDFSPPTVFRIGFAFEPYENEHHRLTASIQLNHPNDNSENLGIGAEYAWEKTFFARAGYKVNTDEEGLTAGVGISAPLGFARTGVDYAFSWFKTLNSVHRVTITLAL